MTQNMKGHLKKLKKQNKNTPYKYFQEAKRVIYEHYINNDLSEKELVKRYNKLYRESDINPLGVCVFLLSTVTSFSVSMFYGYLSGNKNDLNLLEYIVLCFNDINAFTQQAVNADVSASQIILATALIVIMLILLLFVLPSIILLIPGAVFINIQDPKLLIELQQYEMSVIRDMLDAKYTSRKVKYEIKPL